MRATWDTAMIGTLAAAGFAVVAVLHVAAAPFAALAAVAVALLLLGFAWFLRNPRTLVGAVCNILLLPLCLHTFDRIEARIEEAAGPAIRQLQDAHARTGRFPNRQEVDADTWRGVCPRQQPLRYTSDREGDSFTLTCDWVYLDCSRSYTSGRGWRTRC